MCNVLLSLEILQFTLMKALSEVRWIPPACKFPCRFVCLRPGRRERGREGLGGGGGRGSRSEGAARESASQSERAPPAANQRPPGPASLPRSAGRGRRECGAALLFGAASFGAHRAGGVCAQTRGRGRPARSGASPGTYLDAYTRAAMVRSGAPVWTDSPAGLCAVEAAPDL